MIYETYSIGGELYHARSHKYLSKVKTKSGKWRYIYKSRLGGNDYRSDLRQQTLNYIDNKSKALQNMGNNMLNNLRDNSSVRAGNRAILKGNLMEAKKNRTVNAVRGKINEEARNMQDIDRKNARKRNVIDRVKAKVTKAINRLMKKKS